MQIMLQYIKWLVVLLTIANVNMNTSNFEEKQIKEGRRRNDRCNMIPHTKDRTFVKSRVENVESVDIEKKRDECDHKFQRIKNMNTDSSTKSESLLNYEKSCLSDELKRKNENIINASFGYIVSNFPEMTGSILQIETGQNSKLNCTLAYVSKMEDLMDNSSIVIIPMTKEQFQRIRNKFELSKQSKEMGKKKSWLLVLLMNAKSNEETSNYGEVQSKRNLIRKAIGTMLLHPKKYKQELAKNRQKNLELIDIARKNDKYYYKFGMIKNNIANIIDNIIESLSVLNYAKLVLDDERMPTKEDTINALLSMAKNLALFGHIFYNFPKITSNILIIQKDWNYFINLSMEYVSEMKDFQDSSTLSMIYLTKIHFLDTKKDLN